MPLRKVVPCMLLMLDLRKPSVYRYISVQDVSSRIPFIFSMLMGLFMHDKFLVLYSAHEENISCLATEWMYAWTMLYLTCNPACSTESSVQHRRREATNSKVVQFPASL